MRTQSFRDSHKTFLDKLIEKIRVGEIPARVPKNSFVVDIGCGYDGRFLKMISPKIKKGIGYDLNTSKYQDDKISLQNFKILKTLPQPDSSVDVVIALAIIEHLQYPKEILKEILRILKPGGILLMTTPSKMAKPVLEFMAFKLNIISKEEIADHKQYYDKQGLVGELIKAGFKKEKIKVEYFEMGFNINVAAKK